MTARRSIGARARGRGTAGPETGAVFVEALSVIAILTLLFVGLLSVHTLYDGQLHVMRAARAADMAFATNSCQDADKVTAALAPVDTNVLAPPTMGDGPPGGGLVPDKANQKMADKPKAKSALDDTMKDTGFALPKLATFEGHAEAGNLGDSSTLRTNFHATVRSTSAVLCNQPSTRGDVNTAVTHVLDFLK